MATDASPAAPRRRRMVSRRNAGMAFAGGGLAASSVGAGSVGDDHGDTVDDVAGVDDGEAAVADLNAAVEAMAVAVPRVTDDQQSDMVRATQNSEEYTPQNRLAQVRQRSSDYEREYRLQLLHRLLLRNLPLDEIANSMGVSVSTVMRDRTELKERLRSAAKELDIEAMIGHSKGFYEEVQAMAMRAASTATTPLPMRLAAMRTALASHNDMHRFYQAAGVYDVLRFRKGANEGAMSDIQRLMSMTDDLLSEVKHEARRPTNPLGGFSGTDEENMSL